MLRSIIMITTKKDRPSVNQVLAVSGWVPHSLSVAARPIGSNETRVEHASHWLVNYASVSDTDYNQVMELAQTELKGKLILDVMLNSWGDIDHPTRVDGVLASLGLELIPPTA